MSFHNIKPTFMNDPFRRLREREKRDQDRRRREISGQVRIMTSKQIAEQRKSLRQQVERRQYRRIEDERQDEDRGQFERLVNTYLGYYERNENIKEATTTVEVLCFMTGTNFNKMPKYSRYRNITVWFEAVSNWLVRADILRIEEEE